MAPVVSKIRAAMAAAQRNFSHLRGDDLVPEVVKANVWQALADVVRGSAAARQRVGAGKLAAHGALYHIDSGKVEWLGPHPDQARLLA
jgi:carbonic anhydrase